MVLLMAGALGGMLLSEARAQSTRRIEQPMRRLTDINQPPGILGYLRRLAGDVDDTYFQAIRIIGPPHMRVSPAQESSAASMDSPALFGLLVGRAYRFRLSRVGINEEIELYPSIELIGRTYPPPGMELRFPVPVEFSDEDLRLAAAGQYIVRVVYVEDPDFAIPLTQADVNRPAVTDVGQDQDPLAVANGLGRPIAVVRLGSKVPGPDGPDDAFLFGVPPLHTCELPDVTPVFTESADGPIERAEESPVGAHSRLGRIN